MAGGDVQQLADPPPSWSFDDLAGLPDADPRSYEIVDGALLVSPAPGLDHEFVGACLRAALRPALPDGYALAGPVNVDLHPTYRIPDLCVIPTSLFGHRRTLLRPSEVLLVVEIVSPPPATPSLAGAPPVGSRTTDRVTKPAEYAAAGIPGYWRLETEPAVTLTAYALPAATGYTELGTWAPGPVAEITEPFPARIPINDLAPPPR